LCVHLDCERDLLGDELPYPMGDSDDRSHDVYVNEIAIHQAEDECCQYGGYTGHECAVRLLPLYRRRVEHNAIAEAHEVIDGELNVKKRLMNRLKVPVQIPLPLRVNDRLLPGVFVRLILRLNRRNVGRLVGDRDVVRCNTEASFKQTVGGHEDVPALMPIAQHEKQNGAVFPFEGLKHRLRGIDALVVVIQDLLNSGAHGSQPVDGPGARQQQHQCKDEEAR